MEQGIKFVITGDTSGLDSATKKAESALDALNRKIAQLQKEISDNINISQGYEKAISDLSNELKKGTISQDQYAKSLDRLQRDEKETTVATNDLRKQLSLLQRDQKSLLSSTGGAAQGFNNLNKSATNAVPTLTSFSQVIQDAPYGIRGVANNITQLTSQFGYLSKSSGGAGNAIKALLGTLTGPAGILLAVSAVTSILVSYGDEISNIIKGNGSLAASQKEVNKALNEFYGEQVSKLNSYVSILENVNTSEEQRKEITEELIKTVPSLTKADFAYGTNLDIVKAKIGQYVLAQASRIEADTLVQENSEKLAKKARIEQIKSITDEEKRVEAFRKFLEDEGERITKTSLTATYAAGGQVQDIAKTAEEITSDFNKLAENLESDLKPVQDRINELYGITFGGGNAKIDDTKIVSSLDKLKEAQALIKKQLEESILTKGFDNEATIALAAGYKLLTDQINRVNNAFKETKSLIETPIAVPVSFELPTKGLTELTGGAEFPTLNIPISSNDAAIEILKIQDLLRSTKSLLSSIGFDPNQFNLDSLNLEQLTLLQEKLIGAKMTGKIVGDAISNSFSVMAGKMAESLATGNEVLDSFVGSLLSSLSKMISQLIQNAITQIAVSQSVSTASAIQGATQSAAATGPGAIFTLPTFIGIALALIAGAFAGIGSFAQGGIVGGGQFTGDKIPIFVNSGERILTVQDQSFLSNILRGNTGATKNNVQPDIIVGEVVLRGTTQVIQMRRAEKKMNRFYNS